MMGNNLFVLPHKSEESVQDVVKQLSEKAAVITKVLVIYEYRKPDGETAMSSTDNDLEVKDAVYFVRLFEHWLLDKVLG